MMICVGTTFLTMNNARDAIMKALLDADLSWRVHKSDTKRSHLKCKDGGCNFKVRVAHLKRPNNITLSQYVEHGCFIHMHFGFRSKKLVKFLKDEHRAAILAIRKIQPDKCTFVNGERELTHVQPLLPEMNSASMAMRWITCFRDMHRRQVWCRGGVGQRSAREQRDHPMVRNDCARCGEVR